MKLKKKAVVEMTSVIIQLVILAAVTIPLFIHVNSLASDTTYEKDFLKKDIALTLDSIFSSPGNILYKYNAVWSSHSFDYLFRNSEVIVQEEIDEQIRASKFKYGDNLYFATLPIELSSTQQINFRTSGYNLIIEKPSDSTYPLELTYPIINTSSEIKDKKILLYSGILANPSTGEIYQERNSFTNLIQIPGAEIKSTTKNLSTKDFKSVETENVDLIILFNENTQEKNTLNIYIPSSTAKQSRKLASLFLNPLIRQEIVKQPLIIPVKSNLKVPAIYLDIGTELLKQDSLIFKEITNAVNSYYST